jgi:hypothetical protein
MLVASLQALWKAAQQVATPQLPEICPSRKNLAGTDELSERLCSAVGGGRWTPGAVYEKEGSSKELKQKERRPTERRLLVHLKESLGYSSSEWAHGP